MQTFLTDTASFAAIASHLDNKRLHKQTLEGWQCLLTMTGLNPDGTDKTTKGWANHPVVRMWRGHETVLLAYLTATYYEWRGRGYKSTLLEKMFATYDRAVDLGRISPEYTLPSWMLDAEYYERLCSTHRTALLCKHYDWYKQFNWAEDAGVKPATYEYAWPHQDGYVLAA